MAVGNACRAEARHESAPGSRNARGAVDDALRAFAADGGVEVTVRGVSMEPLLSAGYRIRVRHSARPLPGDVVVIRSRGRLVVHRLLGAAPRKGRWRFVTRGDAAPRPDGWIDRHDVIGVAEVSCSLSHRVRALAGFAGVLLHGARRRLRW